MWKWKYTASRSNRLGILAVAILALCGLGLRTARLAERPFHCDEAVQAIKFGNLLEEGSYEYDPEEYHGPTLYYLSLPATWLLNQSDISEVSETQLRLLPALFGVGIILLLLLARDGLGRKATIWAAALTAISPFMVFYSRYYIQETLLIFFALAAILSGWRYYKSAKPTWLCIAGVGIGMMFATKETCIIAWFAMAIAFVLSAGKKSLAILRIPPVHALAGVSSAVIVAVIFFSSFGTHPEGVVESVWAYIHYFTRAAGEGHQQPWYWYLQLIFWHHREGILWTELLIGLLALAGAIAAHCRPARESNRLPRFLSYYTITMLVVYSAIPYKTPWLVLGFLQPMIMLAGYGADTILKLPRSLALRLLLAGALLAGVLNLARQTYLSSFRYYADERNPCVYSHTSTDAVRSVRQIRAVAMQSEQGKNTPIQIIAPEYWPLPWYLRDFTRVGYWHEMPKRPDAPIILTAPEMAEAISSELEGDRFTSIAGLRPGVMMQIIIERKLWDKYIDSLDNE